MYKLVETYAWYVYEGNSQYMYIVFISINNDSIIKIHIPLAQTFMHIKVFIIIIKCYSHIIRSLSDIMNYDH